MIYVWSVLGRRASFTVVSAVLTNSILSLPGAKAALGRERANVGAKAWASAGAKAWARWPGSCARARARARGKASSLTLAVLMRPIPPRQLTSLAHVLAKDAHSVPHGTPHIAVGDAPTFLVTTAGAVNKFLTLMLRKRLQLR